MELRGPKILSGILIRTGNMQNPRDLLDHNTKLLSRRSDSTEFITLGVFSDLGYVNVDLQDSIQTASVKIVCGKDSDNGVVISEVLFRMNTEAFPFI
uniref:Uncharacterized protein n=1 Tax=Ascaris lumbricoides TaxID=6252 RepID=A0A0M3IGQ7_ASCLU